MDISLISLENWAKYYIIFLKMAKVNFFHRYYKNIINTLQKMGPLNGILKKKDIAIGDQNIIKSSICTRESLLLSQIIEILGWYKGFMFILKGGGIRYANLSGIHHLLYYQISFQTQLNKLSINKKFIYIFQDIMKGLR